MAAPEEKCRRKSLWAQILAVNGAGGDRVFSHCLLKMFNDHVSSAVVGLVVGRCRYRFLKQREYFGPVS